MVLIREPIRRHYPSSYYKLVNKRDFTIEKQFNSLILKQNIRSSPLHGYYLHFSLEFKKSVNYLSCIEGKGVCETFAVFSNSMRQLILYCKSLLNKHNSICWLKNLSKANSPLCLLIKIFLRVAT